jgi:putative transposase
MDDQILENRRKTLKAVLHYFYQDNTQSGAHCRYNLKYHIVWIPKYRRSFLSGEIAARLKEVLHEIATDYGFEIIALEVMPDHVHMLIESPPKYAPSKIVGYLKGISSRILRLEFPDVIKKYIWKENTLWARGYYIASLADGVTTGIVQEYINSQKSVKRNQRPYLRLIMFKRSYFRGYFRPEWNSQLVVQ